MSEYFFLRASLGYWTDWSLGQYRPSAPYLRCWNDHSPMVVVRYPGVVRDTGESSDVVSFRNWVLI